MRSTDNDSGGRRFELDPFSLFNDTPTPYCWYGTCPTLFDAPSRGARQPLELVAHSFLATTPLEEVARWRPRRVVPLVGFSWGFTDTGSRVALHECEVLPGEAWDAHLELLRSTYQWWHFAASGEMDPGDATPRH